MNKVLLAIALFGTSTLYAGDTPWWQNILAPLFIKHNQGSYTAPAPAPQPAKPAATASN